MISLLTEGYSSSTDHFGHTYSHFPHSPLSITVSNGMVRTLSKNSPVCAFMFMPGESGECVPELSGPGIVG